MPKTERFGEQIRRTREQVSSRASQVRAGLTRPEATALAASGILDDQLREELLSRGRPAHEVASDPERNARIQRIIDSPAYKSAEMKIARITGLVKDK